MEGQSRDVKEGEERIEGKRRKKELTDGEEKEGQSKAKLKILKILTSDLSNIVFLCCTFHLFSKSMQFS